VCRTSRGVVGSFMDRAFRCSKLQLYAMLTGSRVVRTFPLSFVDLLGLAEANRFPADLQGLYLSAARDRFRALPSHHELRLPFRVRSSCAESLPSLASVNAEIALCTVSCAPCSRLFSLGTFLAGVVVSSLSMLHSASCPSCVQFAACAFSKMHRP